MLTAAKSEVVSDAVQNYVKAIFGLEQHGRQAVSTNELAERLGVTPASASAMAKRLAERGLVAHSPYRGVALTPQGVKVALGVIRRHRLLETYLVEELGMAWDRVHAEAEVLEHVLSEELEALIAAKLGHPTHDPHGDPIPSAGLALDETETMGLTALEVGQRGILVRVSDADPRMLRYLGDRGIAPGDRLEVLEHEPFGGPILVRVAGDVHALGETLAQAMRIELMANDDNAKTGVEHG